MFKALERLNIPPKVFRIITALYRNPFFQVQKDEMIVMSMLFDDIRRDHHLALSHGRLDHLSLMEVLCADD